jgi:two-component system, NtrC family, sensor kinase
MKTPSLRVRLFLSFLLVIAVLGTTSAFFGYHIIKCNVVRRAQNQVKSDLRSARAVYDGEIARMEKSFDLLSSVDNPARIKTQLGLDYLYVVDRAAQDRVKSEIVARAFLGNSNGGTRIIDSAELVSMGDALFRQARTDLRSTPMAHETGKTVLTSALAMEYAVPFFDANGTVARVLYGGKIVNRYFELIDKIHDIVYESKLYHSKPVGTVTIFEDDVRIATNVLDKDGDRAVGTRVSARVYDNVIGKGLPWIDRAFVVTDWYLTAYEPIRDVGGKIVGIFYVGILEQPFTDMIRASLINYLLILGLAVLFAGIIAFLLAGGIAKPITRLVAATDTLSCGDLTHRVDPKTSIRELTHLAESFNCMAEKLHQRDLSLREKNDQLAALNERYLDLVGLVSHELKGILASTMLNACTVRDGHLGDVGPQQKKALDSVVRNLEYFDHTVKNFLNLSRVEKNEITPACTPVLFREDIIDASVEAFTRQAGAKGMSIENAVPAGVAVTVDASLITMVVNNLIGNAIKYGEAGGAIRIGCTCDEKEAAVEVFNTGRPLTAEESHKLFKRFSRLETSPEAKKVRGTGLGLFLSKETIERHGGTLRHEPRENGNAFIFSIPKCGSQTLSTADGKKEYSYA